ncbi:MAG TPA: PLP-dependent transferase, partial [Vicinamibacteria bacterium]|nr:PLP-dependent transferase [Vicinamibacteria bacterium]
ILSLLEPGAEVLVSSSLYGGTARFAREVLPGLGFTSRVVPVEKVAVVDEVASSRSRVLVLESPTNPRLDVVDLEAACASAHRAGMKVFVDNTFATPFLQRPLALGADLVMHSLTKALGGHSDLIGGALLGSRDRVERARSLLKVLGGCMDPHTAFLVERGLRTLHLRVERQCGNAAALARRLQGHPKVARVLHPSLPDHPGHAIARRQMSGFGGVLCLVLKGGLRAAEAFYDGLHLMVRAASLGGVETLVSLPVHTSHHGMTEAQLREAGIDPGMVRIALGVEDEEDLVADALSALERVEA